MKAALITFCALLMHTSMAEIYTAQDLNTSDFNGRVVLCTNNTVSSDNATCVCATGYEPHAGACVACSIGTFKQDDGDHACAACPAHSTTLSASSDTQASCLCEPGYTTVGFLGAGYDCEPCAVDTYKNSIGNHSCSACPRGSTTSHIATVQLT